MYFIMLLLGALFVFWSLYYIVAMYFDKEFPLMKAAKTIGVLLLGILLLTFTLPSLKYMLFKEYDVVKGECVIDIDSSGRSAEAIFKMLDTDEIFTFADIPKLDAYGKKVPYSCTMTVTKDHKWEIGYKIYDIDTKKLILTSE
ncbi:hypothetical protein KGR20_20590 [Cytobacillus oceanisediminis]|nr:hypothetical protein [Cytobacillus oceanisediminis]